jgi:hypothetical protein
MYLIHYVNQADKYNFNRYLYFTIVLLIICLMGSACNTKLTSSSITHKKTINQEHIPTHTKHKTPLMIESQASVITSKAKVKAKVKTKVKAKIQTVQVLEQSSPKIFNADPKANVVQVLKKKSFKIPSKYFSTWPHAKWSYAKVYTYDSHRTRTPWRIIENIRQSVRLNRTQSQIALTLVHGTLGGHVYTKCPFDPRHAIVFYNQKDEEVGAIVICFECTDSKTYPEYYTTKQEKKYGVSDLAFARAAEKAYIKYQRRQRKLKKKLNVKYKPHQQVKGIEQPDLENVYPEELIYKDHLIRWEKYLTSIGADLYDHKKRLWKLTNQE